MAYNFGQELSNRVQLRSDCHLDSIPLHTARNRYGHLHSLSDRDLGHPAWFRAIRRENGKPVASCSAVLDGCRHHYRSEEHTSELQSQSNLVCRLLLEKKKNLSFPALNVTPLSRGPELAAVSASMSKGTRKVASTSPYPNRRSSIAGGRASGVFLAAAASRQPLSEPREVKKRDAFVQIGFVSVLVSLNLTGSDSDSRATQHRTSSVWLVR